MWLNEDIREPEFNRDVLMSKKNYSRRSFVNICLAGFHFRNVPRSLLLLFFQLDSEFDEEPETTRTISHPFSECNKLYKFKYKHFCSLPQYQVMHNLHSKAKSTTDTNLTQPPPPATTQDTSTAPTTTSQSTTSVASKKCLTVEIN